LRNKERLNRKKEGSDKSGRHRVSKCVERRKELQKRGGPERPLLPEKSTEHYPIDRGGTLVRYVRRRRKWLGKK